MADFVLKFHNLEGDLIKERKKNFYKLLKHTSSNFSQADIDDAIQNLDPKTYQEKLFWVETLVYFKKSIALLELLKQGNREYVKIIIRKKWFIEDAFNNTSAKELVDDFFPCVSFSTKLKLLRKISICWGEEKVDALFDALQKRYGLHIALNVLHSCTIEKAKDILKENEILLTTYQVIYIINRNEDLFRIYIDQTKKPYDEENVLNLIALKNPKLFLQLFNSKKILQKLQLTNAPTKKIISVAKQEIINNPQFIIGILNTRALVEGLGLDFRVFYKNTFFKTFQKICLTSHCIKLLKYFPKSRRWELFYETFNANFPNKTIEDLFMVLDNSILTLNPSRDVIGHWAEVNYKETNDENFLQYYKTSISIPMIKEKINVTSNQVKRHTLLKLLITTCVENKDIEAIDKVLEYIGTRHKNEDTGAYKRLIDFVCKTFDKGELTRKNWDFIYQQWIFLQTVGKYNCFKYEGTYNWLFKYFYENDKKIFYTLATQLIQDVAKADYYFYVPEDCIAHEICKEFCNLFPNVISADHINFVMVISQLINEIYEVGEKSPQHCLNLQDFPYLVDTIETLVNKKEDFDTHEQPIIKHAILYHLNFTQYSLPFLNEPKIIELITKLYSPTYSHIFFEILERIAKKDSISRTEQNILLHFLEKFEFNKDWLVENLLCALLLNHPRLLLSSLEKVYSKSESYCYNKVLKHYSHLGFDKRICEYLLKNSYTDKDAVKILQRLLPEDEFINFVYKNFDPDKPLDHTSTKIDIQYYVETLLKDTDNPIKFLPLVLKFCKGIYLPNALPSLYSIFSRSPENMLYPYIETLPKQSVSVQKHAIFLSCQFLDYNHIINVLGSVDSSSYSIHKHVCLASLKYFIKNSSEELFSLLKKNLEKIDKNDTEIFSTMSQVSVPKKYRARYIEICWNIIKSIEDEKQKIKYLDRFLKEMFDEDVLKSASPLFINNIITSFLGVLGENRLKNIDRFAVFCLAYRPNNFTVIFDILSKLNKNMFSGFCGIFVDFVFDKKPGPKFIKCFKENWNKYFALIDSLDEHITLNLLFNYFNHSLENYAQNVVDYFEQLTYELGLPVFEMFKNNFDKLINKMEKLDQYRLFYFMLNYKSSAAVCILVIQLLPPSQSDESELKIAYDKVTQILENIVIPLVKISCEIYLK